MLQKIGEISTVPYLWLATAFGGMRHQRPMRRVALPCINWLEGRTLFSSITVSNLSDHGAGSLRNAIATAGANDVIHFAPELEGTIALTSGDLPIDKSLAIDGPGASKLAVSGDGRSGVFDAVRAGATVNIKDLAIVNGMAADGAAIHNAGGNLSVAYCTFVGNKAVGIAAHGNFGATDADGAAIDNVAGHLIVSHCTFTDNKAVGFPGGYARGGAILNANGGILSVDESEFDNNVAAGGSFGNGEGGAIDNVTDTALSTTHVNASTFLDDRAIGGGHFFGQGGAISNEDPGARGAPLTVTWSTFRGNVAQGGPIAGSSAGNGLGGGIWNDANLSSAAVGHCIFTANQAIGGNGGGFGAGGGIANGYGASITISSCLLDDNLAVGGADGGSGVGGGFANIDVDQALFPTSTPAIIDNSLILNNRATGGSKAGAGQGGGIYNGILIVGPVETPPLVTLSLNDSSIVGNQAGGGSAGNGQGGGIFAQRNSQTALEQTIVTDNDALGGAGGKGVGGGLYVTAAPDAAAFHLVGSIITANDASTSKPNVFGSTA